MMYNEFLEKTTNVIVKKLGFNPHIENYLSYDIYKNKIEPMYLSSDATCASDFCNRYGMIIYNQY